MTAAEKPAYEPPSPDVCTWCHEHKPGDMAGHSGNTHVCQDCAAEAVRDA